jgi:hypothetical protein
LHPEFEVAPLEGRSSFEITLISTFDHIITQKRIFKILIFGRAIVDTSTLVSAQGPTATANVWKILTVIQISSVLMVVSGHKPDL